MCDLLVPTVTVCVGVANLTSAGSWRAEQRATRKMVPCYCADTGTLEH